MSFPRRAIGNKDGGAEMIEMIESPDDVIAVRIADKITGEALDSIMDRLDRAMAAHDKVHVFVETSAIDGDELASLPSYMSRALPLLARLDRFGAGSPALEVSLEPHDRRPRLARRRSSSLLPPTPRCRPFRPLDQGQVGAARRRATWHRGA